LIGSVVGCDVLDSGINLSDHCAIQLQVELSGDVAHDVKPKHQYKQIMYKKIASNSFNVV